MLYNTFSLYNKIILFYYILKYILYMKTILFAILIVFLLLIIIAAIVLQLTIINNEPFSNNDSSIDVIYYINLEHRTDRKDEFLEEMKKANIDIDRIERIPAVYKPNQGDLGCTMSHILTLTKFIDSPYSNCIVFEDDFGFVDHEQALIKINHFLNSGIDYDVCLLSGNIAYEDSLEPLKSHPNVSKMKNVQTASGYLVSKKYAPTLLENYKEGYTLLKNSYDDGTANKYSQPYAVDQYWKKLQETDKWYIFYPTIGKQRNSFSDIMGGNVNYNV